MALQRQTMVNVYKHLIKLNKDYKLINQSIRAAGFLEACLINEGVIQPGEKDCYTYKTSETKFLWMKFKSKEHFTEMIARLCEDFFNENNIDYAETRLRK